MREFVYRLLGVHSVDAILSKHAKTVRRLESLSVRKDRKASKHDRKAEVLKNRAGAARYERDRAARVAQKFNELMGY